MSDTDYSAVLAVTNKRAKWRTGGIGDEGYANLVRTWDDAAPLPSQATLDTAWPAVEADIALIKDMPTKDELDDVALGVITGTPATTILDRRAAALAAKTRIP